MTAPVHTAAPCVRARPDCIPHGASQSQRDARVTSGRWHGCRGRTRVQAPFLHVLVVLAVALCCVHQGRACPTAATVSALPACDFTPSGEIVLWEDMTCRLGAWPPTAVKNGMVRSVTVVVRGTVTVHVVGHVALMVTRIVLEENALLEFFGNGLGGGRRGAASTGCTPGEGGASRVAWGGETSSGDSHRWRDGWDVLGGTLVGQGGCEEGTPDPNTLSGGGAALELIASSITAGVASLLTIIMDGCTPETTGVAGSPIPGGGGGVVRVAVTLLSGVHLELGADGAGGTHGTSAPGGGGGGGVIWIETSSPEGTTWQLLSWSAEGGIGEPVPYVTLCRPALVSVGCLAPPSHVRLVPGLPSPPTRRLPTRVCVCPCVP